MAYFKVTFYLFVYLFSLQTNPINAQLTRVNLVEPFAYMVKVMQELVYELEEFEWCNLALSDISGTTFDEDFYSWRVTGDVFYHNGFISSVSYVGYKMNTIQSTFSVAQNTASVYGTFQLEGLISAYDVVANISGEVTHYTGTYRYNLVEYTLWVVKDLTDNSIVTNTYFGGSSALSSERMEYEPKTSLTEVLGRKFLSHTGSDGIEALVTPINTLLTKVATEKIPFPEICYDCPVS